MKLDEREKIHDFNSSGWRANTLVRGVLRGIRVANNTSTSPHKLDIISEIYRDIIKRKIGKQIKRIPVRTNPFDSHTEVESSTSIQSA